MDNAIHLYVIPATVIPFLSLFPPPLSEIVTGRKFVVVPWKRFEVNELDEFQSFSTPVSFLYPIEKKVTL